MPYKFVYMLSYSRSKAEIMAKQDPNFTSDDMKIKIREHKKLKDDRNRINYTYEKDLADKSTPKTIWSFKCWTKALINVQSSL